MHLPWPALSHRTLIWQLKFSKQYVLIVDDSESIGKCKKKNDQETLRAGRNLKEHLVQPSYFPGELKAREVQGSFFDPTGGQLTDQQACAEHVQVATSLAGPEPSLAGFPASGAKYSPLHVPRD